MASWIVHLRLAERLLEHIPGLDAAYFAIGNIAPDSGVPDEKWERFTPPSEISHFHIGNQTPRLLADLEFYRRYLQPVVQMEDPQRYSFLLGYFFHLVTDNLWVKQIAIPTREKFKAQFEADKNFIWEVKRDWYGLDFEYVRSQPKSLFWRVFAPAVFSGDHLDFMPLEAIRQRMDYIKAFYQRTDDEVEQWYIQHPGCYLTSAEMDGFESENADMLFRSFQFLSVGDRELKSEASVVSLLI